jgi:hypothetical protein
MRPDLEHGVLHHVLGIGRVADDPQRDGVGAIDVALDQETERRLVAGRETIEQVAIFVDDDLGLDRGPAVRRRRGRFSPGDVRFRRFGSG